MGNRDGSPLWVVRPTPR